MSKRVSLLGSVYVCVCAFSLLAWTTAWRKKPMRRHMRIHPRLDTTIHWYYYLIINMLLLPDHISVQILTSGIYISCLNLLFMLSFCYISWQQMCIFYQRNVFADLLLCKLGLFAWPWVSKKQVSGKLSGMVNNLSGIAVFSETKNCQFFDIDATVF